MASLKDIAQAAGVSIRTASRALNCGGYVHAQTRAKIVAAAERLGYRPNRFARSLKTRRSCEIGVLMSSLDELHVAKLASLEQTLRRQGFSVTVLFGMRPEGAEFKPLEALLDQHPAGAIIFPGAEAAGELAAGLAAAGVPTVFIDTPGAPGEAVLIDRPQGVHDAVLYLASVGRRRIAYLGPTADHGRLDGYRAALAELRREPELLPMPEADLGLGELGRGREAGRRFARLPDPPDAVQVFTDILALGFLAGLHDAGLAVPQQVAVVGFDDRAAAATAWPPLTTVAQPNWAVGQAAAELLLARIRGEIPPEGGRRVLPTKLTRRESA